MAAIKCGRAWGKEADARGGVGNPRGSDTELAVVLDASSTALKGDTPAGGVEVETGKTTKDGRVDLASMGLGGMGGVDTTIDFLSILLQVKDLIFFEKPLIELRFPSFKFSFPSLRLLSELSTMLTSTPFCSWKCTPGTVPPDSEVRLLFLAVEVILEVEAGITQF